MQPNQQNSGAPTGPAPRTKADVLKSVLNAQSINEQFTKVLGDSAPAFLASVLDIYNSDSTLQKCDASELVKTALKAAVLRLPINKQLGFAYIVPYKGKNKPIGTGKMDPLGKEIVKWEEQYTPEMQIGYKGYIQLALRSREYRFINADVVYEGEFQRKNKLTGEFDFDGVATSETIVGYFAHLELNSGFQKTVYFTKQQIINHASKYSKTYNSDSEKNPWKKEFDAMALKTAIRNLLGKWGYLSTELADAMAQDIDADSDNNEPLNQRPNANTKPMTGFEEADVVPPDENSDPAQADGAKDGCPI